MDTTNQKTEEIDFSNCILNNSTILYLEDDEIIRNETTSIFEKFFEKVITAPDGYEGLKLYKEKKDEIDIILTDINMPNLNGIGFMTEVRAMDSQIPLLVVTAFNDIDQIIKAIKLKVSDYIVKPMQINTTLKVLHRILQDNYNQKIISKQQSELKIYKEILDQENLISETDLNGIITYANDIFCEVSGYSKEELIGKNHNIVRHPDVSAKVYENLWQTITNKKIWRGKIKNKAKDGSAYYVQSTIFPILDEHGEIRKYVGYRYLITEIEEEKHKLKKYIMHQKSAQIKHEKDLQEQFDEALHYAKMQKDEQIAKFMHELNEQIKLLRSKNSDEKGRVLSLEKKLKESLDKNEELQKSYQKRIEKLNEATTVSIEQYHKYKKKNEVITDKLAKSQEAIITLQGYIDEYRAKIHDLEDVIAAFEAKHGPLSKN
ncbi:MAG: response regulator [Halarcobacter sp.]